MRLLSCMLAMMLMLPVPGAEGAAAHAAVARQTDSASDPLLALIAMEQRVAPIVQRLATGNARWCNDQVASPGWLLGDRRLYRDTIWTRARAAYGAPDADHLFIAALDPDGPAARAGLQRGMAILAINGQRPDAMTTDPHARMAAAHALLVRADPAAPLAISVAGRTEPVIVPAGRGCMSEFRVEASENLRAQADGTLVLISAGMVRFADSDDELAALIAHELAHNILRHRARLDAAAIKRGMRQMFGRSARLTKATEQEADRLAVWLLAGAGYDPGAAARFWTNFGKRHGAGIFTAPTHPRWKQRVAMVTEEMAEIERLRRADPNVIPPLIANPPPLD